ncbi:hypothetical protein BDV96DRAFT_643376 [Lophiotrema nucula]|uniref:Uncharacterized protein n=1 Tax=Lophiotrema nucula TaxID=690887 RepID=A0A6A5ZH69_9PLEO|nr:hypothetical protein BDV96DRAFT_643376 [Lophiotrema nucula]
MHWLQDRDLLQQGMPDPTLVTPQEPLSRLPERQDHQDAADTLQKVYFAFREQAFQRNVLKLEREGSDIKLEEDRDREKLKGRVFGKFPTEFVKSEEEYKAVLSCMSCMEAVGLFHALILQMLPQKLLIEELHVILKNKPFIMKIKYVNEYSQDNDLGMFHTVLRVTSTTTWQTWLWNDFESKHVARILYIMPFGQMQIYMSGMAGIEGSNATVSLGIGLAGAEKKSTSDVDFAGRQKEILELVEATARKFVEDSDFTPLIDKIDRAEADPDIRARIFGESYVTRKSLLKPEQYKV